ncbi:MAG: IPTL-CTERM sorting domain-containing protein [Thermoanaerobaculia bacterium]
MSRIGYALRVLLVISFAAVPASSQPLVKSAVQVDAGNTKQTGQTFGYRLTYNCSNTSGPCLNAEVDDLLPIEVQEISTVPASPTGDVAAINVTNNFMGSGRTRVQFVMIDPLPAGNSGDLLIDVRFPNGSTPNGTVATNTADGVNLGASPGTTTTPPVSVTAVASVQVNLQKTLLTSPANLDMPETYRLRISVPSNSTGALNLTAVGPVVDTLPPGTVFNGSTPAADCQPGCVGTTPATVTWTSPCSVPITPGGNCDVLVNVTFPSATFPSGTMITNSFTVTATPLGQPSQSFGPGTSTDTVTTFVPNASAGLSKNIAFGNPNPPTLNQTFSYSVSPSNNGNVPLDTMVVIDTLPVQLQLASVTTGAYNGLADFAAGVGVRVSYEKNTAPGVFTLWGSSPNATTDTTLTTPPPGLGAGEYVTKVKWEYGQAQPGMDQIPGSSPRITGKIVNPDNAGGPVAFGDTIQNCADVTAVFTTGPTPVSRNVCDTFTLSGPFVQLDPSKVGLTGGSLNPGQTFAWRLRVRSAPQSSDSVPLEDLVATDLLPVDLIFASWTFDDQGTGLPAPQNFQQIPNFAGTGRTLLRWSWNAGSGSLGVGQQVWILPSTTIRNGAAFGPLSNTFTLGHDAPGLSQRCSAGSQVDSLDLDGDGNTAETLCADTGTVTVAPIAQLVSSKQVKGNCDGAFTSSSSGTLIGGNIDYQLRVQNVGTVPMQNFVLVDILPFVGDTGVRDTNPRGSQWMPLLAAPILPPAGTTLYYSTSGNPCRPEVGVSVPGCDPPSWTTVPPSPITSVRSFKVEFGSRVVGPFDFVSFNFHLTAPGNVPAGAMAFNSFAYQADRADGLGSLAAEPQKVGIAPGTCDAASLGDFVWVDANRNGVQDDGPTGLNDVYVRLFSPGPDGVPGTPDDVPLASAVTGQSPTNAPGWYRFPGLAPGSYFVCVTPPPTFVFTTADQGADNLDSDANPATGCSPVVTLVANQDDPDVDFGLVATQLAVLGDYVWIDRNNDGLQNESTWDGVNGVTVKLFADNGNGVADPATDALIATTVTADDVYGRPGYYRFDGLIPGLQYFVQFMKPSVATGFTTPDAGDDTQDSDANATTGVTQLVTLAPGEYNPTIDAGLVVPSGNLALGNQVWLDANNNGIFEPQNGEVGIDNVRLDLYLDANNDGRPTLDEHVGTTFTATQGGFAGRYLFPNLAPGNYVVVVDPSSFNGGGALAGLATATGNDPAPDPDDDVDGDDNGTAVGALTASLPVTLSVGGEPTSEDGNANTNLTVDFGFIAAAAAPQPHYDYGDAPDVTVNTSTGDYNTTVLDNGAQHLLGVPNAPWLGACVDADSGFNQNAQATGDDLTTSAVTFGTCANVGGIGDDEDGVTFTSPFVQGSPAAFTVTAGGPTSCVLNAWVDWNRDGIFGNSAGEQIAADVTVPTGPPTVLSPVVPAGAVPGLTYARFRCSSATGLGPTGPAPDGEVEDYLVSVVGFDYGDAPATYGTQGAGAARHQVDFSNPFMLGRCVDTEADGQPNATASGDDGAASTSRIGNCFNDEDGVTFTTPVTACTTAQVSVFVTSGIAAGGGKLDAWIDFDRNGTFDAADQIFTSQTLVAGNNNLSFPVPCTSGAGVSYARFRLSSAGGLGPTGSAPDGEVEDYALVLGTVDFGDAPDTYGTTLAANGPFHRVTAGFSLGPTEDSEVDGQPSVGATGDGADEDGVLLPAGGFVACGTANITVNLTNTAGIATPKLDAWIDFDGDGVFNDPRDRIASGLALVSGANTVTVSVPCDAKSVQSYARFRLSSTGVSGPGGAAADGEVEDYAATVMGLDFGDAPDPTYPTLLASNGARHAVLPVGNPTLGSFVDTEADGQPSPGLDGDDTHGVPDDEDGVVFPATLIPGAPGSIQLRTGATGGLVSCWIDFNHNGSWADAGDQVVTDLMIPAGTTITHTFPVPVGSPQGTTASRCRISTQASLSVTGLAPDGEVEDHPAPIGVEQPKIAVAKRLVSVDRDPADALAFTVVFAMKVENLGNVPLSNVQATENLAATFPSPMTFSITSVQSPDFTVNPGFNGNGNNGLLAAGNTLDIGGSGTITLTLVVHDPNANPGPFTNQVTATATSPAGAPVSDLSQDGSDPDPNGDGSGTDNDVPTVFQLPVAIALIPTLDTWGLLALAALLGLFAVLRMRRMRRTARA